MRRITFLGVIIFLGAVLTACKVPSNTTNKHVYISGAVGTSISSTVPVYWKDGALNRLQLSNGNTSGSANAIAVDGSGNVYVAGSQGNQIGYWKGTTFTTLSLGTYSVAVAPFSMAIDTYGNVWIGGEVGTATPDTFVYWENSGSPNVLAGSPTGAYGLEADTSGNVYFTGVETAVSGSWLPYVWKNGVNPTPLTLIGGNTAGYPAELAVDSAGNLYICGTQWGSISNTGPYYWKAVSGIWSSVNELQLGAYSANTYWSNFCVTVDSSDSVYFVGATGTSSPTTPLYWKGISSTPTAMSLPSGTSVFDIPFGAAAFDGNGNLIVSGTVGNTRPGNPGSPITDGVPVYWENGSPVELPMGPGNSWGQAGTIAIGP